MFGKDKHNGLIKKTIVERTIIELLQQKENFIMTQSVLMGFDYNDALFISSAIISHMGQWNTSKNGPGKLPTPETPAQKALHLADYLASRKDINMEVEENDNELTPTEEVKE